MLSEFKYILAISAGKLNLAGHYYNVPNLTLISITR